LYYKNLKMFSISEVLLPQRVTASHDIRITEIRPTDHFSWNLQLILEDDACRVLMNLSMKLMKQNNCMT